jgi:para-aminobenzoate synthetase component 1
LALRGHTLVTQPIKGTRKRGITSEEDAALKQELFESEKERAENVMIVDLARNDLYRSSEVNSVEVPHLFEVKSFPQVHHLVSTITGRKRPDLTAWEVIGHAFPPGSMTGAPKVSACDWIDHYERSRRGIYAGSIGYFSPTGDFDLNVVIRTLIYQADSQVLSYHVGGAITYDSDPEAEYEETLVKAKAIAQLLGTESIIIY